MSVQRVLDVDWFECEESSNCHLPEPAKREVEVELGADVHDHDVEDEGQDGVSREQLECAESEPVQKQSDEEGPENVELLFDSQRPQMQERVRFHVWVEVPLLVSQDLDVGSEDCRSCQSFSGHLEVVHTGETKAQK